MNAVSQAPKEMPETRRKLLDAGIRLILRRGFSATTVDQICVEAGVTKGSFFHYFKTKEDLGREVLAAWAEYGMAIYGQVRADATGDPLEQVRRLFDLMIEMVEQSEDSVVCVIGMIAQEMAETNPNLRESCEEHFRAWVDFVAAMLADAKRVHAPRMDFDPENVAWMLHSLWQGSMLIAKTRREPALTVRNLQYARSYVDSLFSGAPDFPNAVSKPSGGDHEAAGGGSGEAQA